MRTPLPGALPEAPPQPQPAAPEVRDPRAAPEQPQSPLVSREPERRPIELEPAPQEAAWPAASLKGRAALVVDDSRMIRRVSRQILEQLGYSVHEAENGQEALARCKVAMPDAILLDWNMPVMTGMEFVAALRATAGGAHPRVIFCTTNSGEPAIREALSNGADGYVVKPFTAQALEAQLQRVRAS
jgi:two-component system, chemotaxis family, chemotaxis protein CheY